MPKCYICRKCGVSYSIEERKKSMFCTKCGTCLTESTEFYSIHDHSPDQEDISSADDLEVGFENVYLLDNFKRKLIRAHQIGSQILRSKGFTPEPLKTALMVEEYRWFWKPKKVKFVLVAESHVRTSKEELSVRIKPERLPSNYPRNSPLNFVKLVYCLGYGQSSILDFPNKIKNNPGTKQYIDLFAELIGLTRQRHYMTKLRWRTHVLNKIKERGVWLLDASVHACYLGKKKQFANEKVENRLPPEIVESLVSISWNRYVKHIIDDLAVSPKCVWIVGKGLWNMLGGRYAQGSNWIYQPNARVTSEKKYNRKTKLEDGLSECTNRTGMYG